MTYFGGLGAGKGWHHLFFFLSPRELADILQPDDCFLLITNGRVPVDSEVTQKAEYLTAYTAYCEAVRNADTITWQLTNPLMISITHRDTAVEGELCPDPRYKLLRTSQPVIDLMPLVISYAEQRLHVNVSSSVETVFGLMLSFPKVVFYQADDFHYPHATQQFHNYHLYERMATAIMMISRPARFKDLHREYRTRIRMSGAGWGIARYHAFLAEHGLHVSLPKSRRTAGKS